LTSSKSEQGLFSSIPQLELEGISSKCSTFNGWKLENSTSHNLKSHRHIHYSSHFRWLRVDHNNLTKPWN
jgi:hypothetical protein